MLWNVLIATILVIIIQIEENPLMPQNAQFQVDKLISLYKKGLCKKEYILNLQKVLREMSDELICLDLSGIECPS